GSDLVVTLSNGQTITIPVGASSASGAPFAVRADDAYVQGDQSVDVAITGASGGSHEGLNTSSTVSTGVSREAEGRPVTLRASAVYTASVNNAVTGSDLIVTLSNGQTITIPVGASSASSAPFAVRADDAYVEGDQTVDVAISGASGGNHEGLNTSSTVSTVVS